MDTVVATREKLHSLVLMRRVPFLPWSVGPSVMAPELPQSQPFRILGYGLLSRQCPAVHVGGAISLNRSKQFA